MSKYNNNCQTCRMLVYGVPVLVVTLGAIAVFMTRNADFWLAYLFATPIFLPFSIWMGKRIPMLHEYFKEGKV